MTSRPRGKRSGTALAQCLDSLPARNQVLVCGDMNTQLPYCKGATGKAVRKSTYRDSRDERELLDILRLHGLVAVNTFHDPKPYTYSGAGSRTQLDYVFMRTNQASGLSKQARGLHQFPLLAACGDGFHVPLLARIPGRWRVWHYGSQPPRPKGPSRPELSAYIAARARDLDFHLAQVVQPEVTDIDGIDKALLQAQQQMEDTMQYQPAQAQRPWQNAELRETLRQAWTHLRLARSHRRKHLRNLFQAWRHIIRFHALIKSTRRHCRRLRRMQLLGILNDAKYQAHNRNINGVFKLVDRLAPKRYRGKPQMRTDEGLLMDTAQEAEEITKFLHNLYQGPACSDPLLTVHGQGQILETRDILEGLRAIPARKAGPKHLALNIVYKQAASRLAPIITDFLQAWWSGRTPYIPQSFKDAWLIMLPKPGRVCKGPADLRPIGLSHPVGKALLRALRQKILPYATQYMAHTPQWGYLPGREAADSLANAFRHCAEVRALCQTQTLNINSRRAGHKRSEVVGGLAIALDISRAFDTIPHSEINLALQAAGVPGHLRQLVLLWITGARYHVQGDSGTIAVDVCRGVRQGCVLSPLLYILVVARLHDKLREAFGGDADKVLDYYADDTFFHVIFTSRQGLYEAMGRAEQLLATLTKAGLTINDDKTQVLIKLSGSQAKQVYRDLLDERQGTKYVRLTSLWQQRFLPICDKVKYLGARLTYGSFEDAAVHHRVTAARAAYGRLRRILTTRSNLSLASRVGLWTSCVGTCLYYALDSSGVTINGLQQVRVLVQKQLRAIARLPTHLTHISNQDLLLRLGIEEPGAYILKHMQSLFKRWQANQESDCPIPVKAQESIGQWRRQVRDRLSEQLQQESAAGRTRLQCPYCNLEFPNQSVLGSHISATHAPTSKPVFDRLKHSVEGMPKCSGCRTLFSSWARLQKHIEHGACPSPVEAGGSAISDPSTDRPAERIVEESARVPTSQDTTTHEEPLILQPEVREILRQHGWRKLVYDKTWRPKLAQWCALCGTWCASNRAVKMHLAKSHKQVWNFHKHRVETLSKSQLADIQAPCQLCGSGSKDPKSHAVACPVIFQSILLALVSSNGSRSRDQLLQALAAGGESTEPHADGSQAGGDARADNDIQQASQDGAKQGPQGSRPGSQARCKQGPSGDERSASRSRSSATGGGDGQAHPEASGCTTGSSTGLWLYMVRQHGARRNPANHVRGERGVEEADGKQPTLDQKPAPHVDDELHPGGTGGPDAEDSGRGDHAEGSASGRMVHGSRGLGLQAMGSDQERAGGHQGSSVDPNSLGDHRQGNPDRHSGAGQLAQIPSIAAPERGHGNDGGASRSLLHDPGLSTGVGGAALWGPQKALRQHGAKAAAKPTSTRKATPTGGGQVSGRTATTSALHLMLRNVDNTCYINSLVHIISWMLECTGTQVTCLGLGQHAWRAILVQRKAVVVHRLIPWSFLMQGWSHGGQQHDICEFFSHLLCRMQTSPFQGTWSARYVEAGRTYIHDYGECSGSHLLTLDVPTDGQWNLQDQVNAWMGQAFTHALKSAPQWLAIRLNRFHRPTASGAIRKVRTALSWCTAVTFPVFVDTTLEVYRTTYAVRAFAVHLGASPTSGHYRALLYDDISGELHYCDDHVKPVLLHDFHTVSSDIYVVVLSRQQDP